MNRLKSVSKRWQTGPSASSAAIVALGVVLSTTAFTFPGKFARPDSSITRAAAVPMPARFKTMVSKEVGWALSASNQVLRTTNGGKSWIIVSSAHNQITPIALSADTASRALLVGAPRQNQAAIVWATDNAGRHWQTERLPDAVHATGATVDWFSPIRAWMLVTLAFSTNQKPPPGYPPPGAMGFENVLYRTTDAGNQWSLVPSATVPDQVNQMIFTTRSTGWMSLTTDAIGPSVPLLAKTVNGGQTWKPLVLPRPPLLAPHSAKPKIDYAPYAVSGPTFSTPNQGAFLTSYGALNANGTSKPTYSVVYYTTDGGNRWQWMLLPPYQTTDQTGFPVKVVWQSTKTGWLLNVLDSAGTVVAQWPVGS
ncbi:MAG: hypothetical protein C7B45_07255 [Sulfobacillus acidophilus]|uniref:Photosynthesis system II assembly factor Ycf48/Hcf136-like domain-containing protein n=1 Tax=Sulfobacillus acidophilus TaxID=53633 RepID=A0A2T2WJ82_9FIRM|nr:MAG: hypothetical protein C7B45_07255 [Sulfobacillus acidophilus]